MACSAATYNKVTTAAAEQAAKEGREKVMKLRIKESQNGLPALTVKTGGPGEDTAQGLVPVCDPCAFCIMVYPVCL
ncbi:hypothetical protein ACFTAO_37050 [Paenibacillus rhizoplanae]